MRSVREVAKLYRVSPATIYRWIHAGHLKAVRHGKPYIPGSDTPDGGAIRIPESELEDVVSEEVA